jgi:HSP20 family molecular chaperone IbpA
VREGIERQHGLTAWEEGMVSRAGSSTQSSAEAESPEIVYGARLGDLKASIQHAIAHRAYEFFEARGRQHGSDLEDWFRSETELLHPQEVKIWESANEISVTAEVPGFLAEELKIGVEPGRVVLWGQVGREPNPGSSYPARAPLALFHSVDLPANVDPTRSSATLADGLLKLVLLKVAEPRA